MISQKIETAFNEQINAELYSGYLYLSMAAHFAAENLAGMSNWMRVQAMEEVAHAQKFYDHVLERGGSVRLTAIEAPPTQWETPLAAFEAALKHEKYITKRINDLAELAEGEKDRAAGVFLQWFITEQVEEEAHARDLVERLRWVGDKGPALLMINRELTGRQFHAEGGES